MRSDTLTTSRKTSSLAIVACLLASSAGAQTVQPAFVPDLTSEAPKTTQQPPTGGTVQDASIARGRRWGYIFGGVGRLSTEHVNNAIGIEVFRAVDSTKHFGGGMEWQLSQSIGIAAEGSIYLVPDVGFAALSVNGSYRFRSAPPGQPSLVPFVTGGLSLPGPLSPGLNIGVGADYWLRGRDGLRFEVRATRGRDERVVGTIGGGDEFHFFVHPWLLDFRIGINFRRSPGTANRPRTTSRRG